MHTPENLLLKRLVKLSSEVTRYRFEIHRPVSSFGQSISDMREQFLVAMLAKSLPLIEEKLGWEDHFILLAFIYEWTSSIWGSVLFHTYLETGYQRQSVPGGITRLPSCLLPQTCLICNNSLGITKENYPTTKRGRGKLFCERCSLNNSINQGFTREEEAIPEYMRSYTGKSARYWKQITKDAFKLLDSLDSRPKDSSSELILNKITEAYQFIYSQYIAPDREYRPRYQIFHDYPTSWLYSLFYSLIQGKKIRLKVTEEIPETRMLDLDKEIRDLYLPPFFSKSLNNKLLFLEVPLQSLEKHFNM